MSDWLEVLNDEQRSAVEQTEGYVCLHAGAGTGKTRTLTYRYAYLIKEYGISPRSVWCVTFTNKAAVEMKQRVQRLCGNAIGNPFVTTFHGFCALFLREEIMAIGWPKTFTICDVSDVKDLLRPLYKECNIDGKKLSLKKAWEFIDAQKGTKDYISALIGHDSSVLIKRSEESTDDALKIFWRYLFAQRTTYSLDFDDLILLTLHILENFPEVRERWQKRLEYILVDEFQDIDRDQYMLVEILAAYNNNLFIVGDPDQTIYSFRGARVEYFQNFVQVHGSQAHKLNLTYNYRSQAAILQAAYSVISNNPDPDRLPLIAMREDITLDDMIISRDPNSKIYEKMSPQVAAHIAKRSYYSSLNGSKGHNDRLAKAVGFKHQKKLERIGLEPRNTSFELNTLPDSSNDYELTKEQSSTFTNQGSQQPLVSEANQSNSAHASQRHDSLQGNEGPQVGNGNFSNQVSPWDRPSNGQGITKGYDFVSSLARGFGNHGHNGGHEAQAMNIHGAPVVYDLSAPGPNESQSGYGAQEVYGFKSERAEDAYWALRNTLTEVPNKKGQALSLKPLITHASSVYTEADYVVDCIKEIRYLEPEASIAILYRAHYVAMQFENALVAAKIPYNVIGDLRFFDRKEIRDVIAYIRLRVNLDDDVAFRRVVNVPPRGFGKKRMEKLEFIAKQQSCSLFRALLLSQDDEFLFARQTKMPEFIKVMSELSGAPFKSPVDDFEFIINNTGYEEWIKESGEDERLENIATLKSYLADFKKNQDDEVNLADFISNVTLMTSADESSPINAVRLMTVHNAKGLEFDYVFVVSVNEAVFPSKKAINELNVEEERRLMYVAMTRARKQLFLSEAGGMLQNRQDPQAKIPRLPSRFLAEIQKDAAVEIGGSYMSSIAQNDFRGSMENTSNLMSVGERFRHKLLGEGIVQQVRVVEGEYVVFYEKLGRERTLSFTAKFERLSASAPQPQGPAMQGAQGPAAQPNGYGMPVMQGAQCPAAQPYVHAANPYGHPYQGSGHPMPNTQPSGFTNAQGQASGHGMPAMQSSSLGNSVGFPYSNPGVYAKSQHSNSYANTNAMSQPAVAHGSAPSQAYGQAQSPAQSQAFAQAQANGHAYSNAQSQGPYQGQDGMANQGSNPYGSMLAHGQAPMSAQQFFNSQGSSQGPTLGNDPSQSSALEQGAGSDALEPDSSATVAESCISTDYQSFAEDDGFDEDDDADFVPTESLHKPGANAFNAESTPTFSKDLVGLGVNNFNVDVGQGYGFKQGNPINDYKDQALVSEVQELAKPITEKPKTKATTKSKDIAKTKAKAKPKAKSQ